MMTPGECNALGAIVDNALIEPRRLIQLLLEREAALIVESETPNKRAALAWEATLDADDGATLADIDRLTLEVAGRLIRQIERGPPIGFAAAARRAIDSGNDARWAIELHAADNYSRRTGITWQHSQATLGPEIHPNDDADIMRWCTQQPDLWPHERRAWIAGEHPR